MFENWTWGLANFLLYLFPVYIFMLNALNDKFKWHSAFDNLFSEFAVLTCVPVVSFIAFVYNNIWRYIEVSLMMWLMYLGFFIAMYLYLIGHLSYFQSFVISSLSVFAISEIWEIPIKLNNLLTLPLGQGLNILIMSAFKMSSILMLLYFVRKWKWRVSEGQRDLIIFLSLISTFLMLQGLTNTIDFSYAMLLRIVVGITISVSVVGYSRSQNEMYRGLGK